MVSAAVTLSRKLSAGKSSNSIDDFKVLKLFGVEGHVSKAPKISQVSWSPPKCGWVKCK